MAKSLSGELGIPERTARDVLEKLEHGEYIRRFAMPGRHACYPILVHKFLITDGGHGGEQLNAIHSRSPADLAYFSREHDVEEHGEHGVEHSAAQKRKRIEKEKNPAAKPTRPADPRRQPFIHFAWETFQAKYGQKPTWAGKDWKGLAVVLAVSRVTLEELKTRWTSYPGSTEAFTAKQGGSLAYFCSIDGPLLEPVRGGKSGKLSGEDLTRANLAAAGYKVN